MLIAYEKLFDKVKKSGLFFSELILFWGDGLGVGADHCQASSN